MTSNTQFAGLIRWTFFVLAFVAFQKVKAAEVATSPVQQPTAGTLDSGAKSAPLAARVSSWKSYQDEKNKFQIEYPVAWKVTPAKEPQLVQFHKADKTAVVSVLKAAGQEKSKTVEFLNQMDESRKASNLIPTEQRKLSAELAKKVGADEGAIGYYEMPGSVAVLQRTIAFKKGPMIFVVTGSFQKTNESVEDPLIEAILSKFKFQQ